MHYQHQFHAGNFADVFRPQRLAAGYDHIDALGAVDRPRARR